MKTAQLLLFGIAITGAVIADRAPLHAQTMTDAAVVVKEDKPWSVGVSIEDRQAARTLFLEGNRLFRIPVFARAAEQYAAALGKWKHPAFYYNLALAQLNLGREVEAHDNLVQVLQRGRDALGADLLDEAQNQLREIERQLGRIRVRCSTPGAEVTVDGVALFVGPGNAQVWVKAKSHEVTAKKPNYLSEATRVMVSAGQLKDVELRLITLDQANEVGRRWPAWKPWAVVAAGAAVAATGGVLHVLSSRNFNAYDREFLELPCAKTSMGCKANEVGPALDARIRRAEREQQLAVGGYIVGGSLIAAGAVLLYLNRPSFAEQPEAGAPAGRIAVVPTISADLLGIRVSVSH